MGKQKGFRRYFFWEIGFQLGFIYFTYSEGLPTKDLQNTLEKVLAEWKESALHLEEVARKMQGQDEINACFKEMDELDRTLAEKESWLKDNAASSSWQQPLTNLRESSQVTLASLFILRNARPLSSSTVV